MNFETHRPQLFRLAYGMLGSHASAEDIVQEAWIRMEKADGINNPGAWLRKVVSRLALDELKSARSQREQYVGPWLPEPLPTDDEDPVVFAEALSLATLSVLEQLSAPERAAFLLREIYELGYPEIAALLDKSEPATRQLVRRSRQHLQEHRPRFEPARDEHLQLLAAMGVASQTGDLEGLKALLAEGVRFVSDGGGKATAALRPVVGIESVARLMIGLTQKFGQDRVYLPRLFNGQHGMVVLEDEVVVSAVVICIDGGKITAVLAVRNPDKLTHLQG